MKKKKNIVLFTLIFFILLLAFPKTSFESAKSGLMLWFETVVPSLLPFLILSHFMIFFQITPYVSQIFAPLLCPLLKISKHACYPLVLGMLSGYPLGAKTCNDFITEGLITKEEGNHLILLCNNASPMFLTYYVACYCLNAPSKQYLYYFIILISSFITFFCSRIFVFLLSGKKRTQKRTCTNNHSHCTYRKSDSLKDKNNFLPFLDKAILSSAEILVKVGGYIILFSILATQIISIPYLPLSLKSCFASIFEITIGTHSLSALSVFSHKTKTALILSLASFGGLSALLQTKSVILESGLSIKHYFLGKCFSALLTFVFVKLLFFLHII